MAVRNGFRSVVRVASALAVFCGMAAKGSAGDVPALAAPVRPKVDYNFTIRPILSDRCFLCHGPDERARKADLRLDKSESAIESGAIVPGKPDESELIRRITLPASDADHMPPRKSNLSLSVTEVEALRRWVAEGAEYKPHWAFLPPPEVVPEPEVSDPKWPAGAVDRFILARLDREGLKPSSPASKEEWLRRVTFDLTGLPPAPADADAFLAEDSPRAFERVVDRLLASKHFGERMAMEWLDVARYADSFGYQADGDTNVWPWRDWVIKAFNENLPYDKFVTWQVAGDRLPNPTRDQHLATAFSRLHRMTNEGGSIPEEWRNEYVSDRVHTFGTAFLALTLECTRCHDHKYDPLTMKDYYSLGAFFNSIDEWGTYDSAAFRPTPTLPLPTTEQEKTIAALRKAVTEAEAKLAAITDSEKGVIRFHAWLKGDFPPKIRGLAGHYTFETLEGGKLFNAADPKKPGKTANANTLGPGTTGLVAKASNEDPAAEVNRVPGEGGHALQFTGDDAAEFDAAPATVERHQPFTAAFWLWLPEAYKSAIVFHREAGTDTGFHGAEMTVENGRLRFALVRFWPGNALSVITPTELPVRQWVHVALTYDGSGKAQGVRFYLNGAPAGGETERDNLTKNVEVNGSGFVFGDRFRSPGLKDGRIDELRLYNRALSGLEVAALYDGKSLADPSNWQSYRAIKGFYFEAIDDETKAARDALKAAREKLFAAETAVNEIMTMDDLPVPRPSYVLARGAYDAPRDRPVGRESPAFLPPFPKDAPRDRLGLARWLTDPNHPLTARVAVNRYWQLFFGRGLVATTENFGLQGGLPTHPELLDWLARHFVQSGWDVKALCKMLVLSSTYRQDSSAAQALRERDPDNLLHAHGPSLRLSAEMLRDSALSTSGLLVETIGGPPVKPSQPPGLWKGQNAFLPEYIADKGPNAYRRSLYTFWRRTSPPPNMLAFDAPSREVCVVRRQSTTTPLQPLVLLNDPQFVDAAVALGERMLGQGGLSDPDRVTFAFRLAATRRPTDREKTVLVALIRQQRDAFHREPGRARAFLAASDRKPSPDLVPADLAAASVTASVILNLDAAVTAR
jgi:hypothetical protein